MESAMVEAEPATATMKNQLLWYESYSMSLLGHSAVSIRRDAIARELRRVCDIWNCGELDLPCLALTVKKVVGV
jgi:hypothetical protein